MHRTAFLALRALRTRPLRTALTTFGIVLGVAVILSINITNTSTLAAITQLFSESSGRANLIVTHADAGVKGFDEALRDRAATADGVLAAVPTVQEQALVAEDDARGQIGLSFFGLVPGGLTVYGIDPAQDGRVREYKLVAGEFLSADLDTPKIVLVKDFAERRELGVGDRLVLRTPTGNVKLTIVGLMAKEGPGRLNNGAFGVMPLRTAQKIFDRAGEIDQLDLVAAPGSTSTAALDRLKAALQARLGAEYAVLYPATQGKRVAQMVSGYQSGLDIFSLIAVFVGAFLIYNAFSMTVVERTREIGMLRTIGMTRRQIMGQILIEAVLLGVIGSAIGLALGIVLAQGLIRLTEVFLAQEVREVQIPPEALALGVIVGLTVTLIATVIPAWQASRISPLEALRVRANARQGWGSRNSWRLGLGIMLLALMVLFALRLPQPLGARVSNLAVLGLMLGGVLLIPAMVSLWERLARPWMRRLYGREGQLGSRNLERARWRTALTVAALMIGVAMILSVRAVTSAFDSDLRSWIEVYIGGDLFVYSSLPMKNDLQAKLATVPGVQAVTPIRYLDVRRVKPNGETEALALTAVDPTSYGRVTSFAFTANQLEPAQLMDELARGDTVFVSSVLAEKYGLGRGDTVRLQTRRGERDFTVAAVVVDFYNRGNVVQGSWEDLQRYFRVEDASAYLLSVEPGVPLAEVQQRIDTQYGRARDLTVQTNESLKSSALGLIGQTSSLFDVLAVIAMVVASLGVVNTMTMNVVERTRELGMLRSLGMTRWQIGKMVLAEAGLIGLMGGALGLLFGLFQSRVVILTVNATAGYDLNYVLPVQGIAVSVVIALLVSQLAALWPALRAARLRIIEAIQFE
jgi:putative ABC transport system permease protein